MYFLYIWTPLGVESENLVIRKAGEYYPKWSLNYVNVFLGIVLLLSFFVYLDSTWGRIRELGYKKSGGILPQVES
jgi:hypothetical protein